MTNRFFAGQTDYIEQLNALDVETGDHIADTTGAHAATAISNTPAGNIAATTVQGAINELDTEKLSASAATLPSSFVNASLNSITPTGGTLSVNGGLNVSNVTGRVDITALVGTNSAFIKLVTDGGQYYVGTENSAGTNFGCTAYAQVTYVPAGRVIQQFVDGTGVITEASAAGFKVTGLTTTDTLRVSTSSTPASASATGAAGTVTWDADYVYVCTATNTWKRAALSTW